jgi:hypothetical protein
MEQKALSGFSFLGGAQNTLPVHQRALSGPVRLKLAFSGSDQKCADENRGRPDALAASAHYEDKPGTFVAVRAARPRGHALNRERRFWAWSTLGRIRLPAPQSAARVRWRECAAS